MPTPPRKTTHVVNHLEDYHRSYVDEVREHVAADDVVVVGMKHNPHVMRARRALRGADVRHTYLEYGSYMSKWRERLAVKLWTGWPTFPAVFVRGVLVGGANELEAMVRDGRLQRVLESGWPADEL